MAETAAEVLRIAERFADVLVESCRRARRNEKVTQTCVGEMSELQSAQEREQREDDPE